VAGKVREAALVVEPGLAVEVVGELVLAGVVAPEDAAGALDEERSVSSDRLENRG
jgi:hypothetical protein